MNLVWAEFRSVSDYALPYCRLLWAGCRVGRIAALVMLLLGRMSSRACDDEDAFFSEIAQRYLVAGVGLIWPSEMLGVLLPTSINHI